MIALAVWYYLISTITISTVMQSQIAKQLPPLKKPKCSCIRRGKR